MLWISYLARAIFLNFPSVILVSVGFLQEKREKQALKKQKEEEEKAKPLGRHWEPLIHQAEGLRTSHFARRLLFLEFWEQGCLVFEQQVIPDFNRPSHAIHKHRRFCWSKLSRTVESLSNQIDPKTSKDNECPSSSKVNGFGLSQHKSYHIWLLESWEICSAASWLLWSIQEGAEWGADAERATAGFPCLKLWTAWYPSSKSTIDHWPP